MPHTMKPLACDPARLCGPSHTMVVGRGSSAPGTAMELARSRPGTHFASSARDSH